jgi:hypothetical protein
MANPLLSLTLADAYGRTTTKLIEMERDPLDWSNNMLQAANFIDELQAVTDLACVRADLIDRGIDDGFDVTAGANVDTGATFTGFLVDGNGAKASFKIPGIKPALVNSDGSIPITGAVATLLAEFTADEQFLLSDGEKIESWISGSLDK